MQKLCPECNGTGRICLEYHPAYEPEYINCTVCEGRCYVEENTGAEITFNARTGDITHFSPTSVFPAKVGQNFYVCMLSQQNTEKPYFINHASVDGDSVIVKLTQGE